MAGRLRIQMPHSRSDEHHEQVLDVNGEPLIDENGEYVFMNVLG
jgi:hypothetical protein